MLRPLDHAQVQKYHSKGRKVITRTFSRFWGDQSPSQVPLISLPHNLRIQMFQILSQRSSRQKLSCKTIQLSAAQLLNRRSIETLWCPLNLKMTKTTTRMQSWTNCWATWWVPLRDFRFKSTPTSPKLTMFMASMCHPSYQINDRDFSITFYEINFNVDH